MDSRTAVVTGGSYGIGLAVAQRFIAEGYRVLVAGRTQARLDAAMPSLGPTALAIAGDVASAADVERIAALVADRFGRVDVLVNNAGLLESVLLGSGLQAAEAVYDRVVGSSLKGAFLMTHALAPFLTAPGGRVINMGSIVAHSGGTVPGYTAYTSAKAGLHGLTMATARELGPRGITANTVAPGFTAETGQTEGWDDARIGPILARIPLGRAGTMEDIAAAVAWLAGPEASYVTGMTLPVNGGWQFSL